MAGSNLAALSLGLINNVYSGVSYQNWHGTCRSVTGSELFAKCMCIYSAALADEALTALEAKTKDVEVLQRSLDDMQAQVTALSAELEQASEQTASLHAKVKLLTGISTRTPWHISEPHFEVKCVHACESGLVFRTHDKHVAARLRTMLSL